MGNSEDDKFRHNLEYRFQHAAENVMFDGGHKSHYELFLGHYPDLNQKELIVCEVIVSAMWDLGDTYYDAIVSTIPHYYKEVFSDEKEVEYTIKNLIEKGILKLKIPFLPCKPPPGVPECSSTTNSGNRIRCENWLLNPRKFIDFTNADIQHEGWMIISRQFSDVVNAAFGPNASEDSIKIDRAYYKTV